MSILEAASRGAWDADGAFEREDEAVAEPGDKWREVEDDAAAGKGRVASAGSSERNTGLPGSEPIISGTKASAL